MMWSIGKGTVGYAACGTRQYSQTCPARERTSRARDSSITPSRGFRPLQRAAGPGMKQGEQVPHLDVGLKFFSLRRREFPLLVSGSQVFHAALVVFTEAEREDVPGQLRGHLTPAVVEE